MNYASMTYRSARGDVSDESTSQAQHRRDGPPIVPEPILDWVCFSSTANQGMSSSSQKIDVMLVSLRIHLPRE